MLPSRDLEPVTALADWDVPLPRYHMHCFLLASSEILCAPWQSTAVMAARAAALVRLLVAGAAGALPAERAGNIADVLFSVLKARPHSPLRLARAQGQGQQIDGTPYMPPPLSLYEIALTVLDRKLKSLTSLLKPCGAIRPAMA